MLNALQAYLKKPATIIGIVTAMMFQVIFSIIWMTGYAGVTDNTKHLKIAIVNEDNGTGAKVIDQLKENLPFQLLTDNAYDSARQRLERREVQMVLHIPGDFTKQLQTPGQKAQIEYTINESNPALIKTMMQGVANGVTATVNKEAVAAGAQAVLTQANIPAQQAQGMAQGLAEKVTGQLEYIHPVNGMANQMIPMMLVLASFVGAMIMGMNIQQATGMMGHSIGKWSKFAARMTINVISAVFIALVGTSLVLSLGGTSAGGFLSMWLFQTLFLLTFMIFSQMFLILFGMAGMLFNITMLSVQLVSSGAMVPRELLSDFYLKLSEYLPATYAVRGIMNIVYDGSGASAEAWNLVMIMLVCGLIGAAVTGIRRQAVPVPSRAEAGLTRA
ncbi:ABC transporter permease [Paenibacillus vulneris]|uniref:YhgE/Pip domain-containing protein n=1 Tax=Paenibacillus vulneris TaxID=1133364 RepID=A0ABW3UWW9_9BACL|nr:ABC transporter permease [Paenibacillus sp. 32352]